MHYFNFLSGSPGKLTLKPSPDVEERKPVASPALLEETNERQRKLRILQLKQRRQIQTLQKELKEITAEISKKNKGDEEVSRQVFRRKMNTLRTQILALRQKINRQ